MPQKNEILASKRLNKVLSVIKNNLFCMEVLWCRTVYDDVDIPNPAMHSHSFYELHLCLSAQNCFKTDNKTIVLKRGEFLLLSPGTKHTVHSYQKGYSELVLAFDFLDECNIYNYLKSDNAPFYTNNSTEFMLNAVSNMLNHIIDEKYGYSEYITHLASCFFIDLFAVIAKKIDDETTGILKENDDRIEQVKKYIEDNIYKKLQADEIARHVNISPRHLNRIIKNSDNASVTELIRRMRIKHAKKLLMTTQKTITEIAYETGFGSSFHLIKTFKTIEGITPGAYRRDFNK